MLLKPMLAMIQNIETLSLAGSVCRDDFQPGFSTNDYSTSDLDHLFPAIWWLIFCTYAAGWVS